MRFFELATHCFWHFIGIASLLTVLLKWSFLMWNRFWRHWNIRKHGYPPRHCDADGDAVVEEEETKEG